MSAGRTFDFSEGPEMSCRVRYDPSPFDLGREEGRYYPLPRLLSVTAKIESGASGRKSALRMKWLPGICAKVCNSAPEAASHNLTVSSKEPDAIHRPSGEKATELNASGRWAAAMRR
jgi:hypothetical protein